MIDVEKMAGEAGISCQPMDRRQSNSEVLEGLERFAQAVARRCADLLQAEHEKRKHLDNHAAVYANMIRAEFGIEGE